MYKIYTLNERVKEMSDMASADSEAVISIITLDTTLEF